MLISRYQLTQSELIAVKKLSDSCKAVDQHAIFYYPNLLEEPREYPTALLYYEDEQLIGFAALFYFYRHACEIALMVHPAKRKQGIANQLLQALQPFAEQNFIKELIFSVPHHHAEAYLTANHFTYLRTEYTMQLAIPAIPFSQSTEVMIRPVKATEIETLMTLDALCFPQEAHETPMPFAELLKNPHYIIFICLKNGQIIGKAHLALRNEGARLSDIAIRPSEQGQGWGSYLINYCIQYAQSVKALPISLDVETTNLKALNIYLRLGFETINACDFWSTPVDSFYYQRQL